MADITLKGAPLKTIGSLPAIGSQAPDFTVTKVDLGEINLKNYLGRKIVLNIFPSLDTPTCSTAMLRFNQIAEQIKDILILCISADLPFAQKRFCSAQHLDNVQPVSVFRHPKFGEHYGVTIIDGPLAGLLSRAVLLLDEQGKVVYSEQVHELSDEPNYSALLAILGISTSNLKDIVYEWQNNLAFREAFKKNPEQALKSSGFTVKPEDLTKILAMLKLDKSMNEKLDDRISK